MASREELLQSIGPDMRLDKWFFLRIYGYELTWPGFAEVVYSNQKGNHAMNERKERGLMKLLLEVMKEESTSLKQMYCTV